MPSFSTTLEQSIHAALALANARRHELATLEHLLLALGPPVLVTTSGGDPLAKDEVELERLAPVPRSVSADRAAAAAATAAAHLTAAGVQATSTVRSGLARDQILAFAEQEQADVIVVGASTRPAVATRLLGSTPLAVVARSTRPVLVVTRPPDASA